MTPHLPAEALKQTLDLGLAEACHKLFYKGEAGWEPWLYGDIEPHYRIFVPLAARRGEELDARRVHKRTRAHLIEVLDRVGVPTLPDRGNDPALFTEHAHQIMVSIPKAVFDSTIRPCIGARGPGELTVEQLAYPNSHAVEQRNVERVVLQQLWQKKLFGQGMQGWQKDEAAGVYHYTGNLPPADRARMMHAPILRVRAMCRELFGIRADCHYRTHGGIDIGVNIPIDAFEEKIQPLLDESGPGKLQVNLHVLRTTTPAQREWAAASSQGVGR